MRVLGVFCGSARPAVTKRNRKRINEGTLMMIDLNVYINIKGDLFCLNFGLENRRLVDNERLRD